MKYKEKLDALLIESIGKSDVTDIEFKQITPTTKLKNLDFKKVRGSIRLSFKNVRTQEETNKIIEDFIKLRLP